MKILKLTFIIVILFISSCKKNDVETPNSGLKGKVKTITEYSYEIVVISGVAQKGNICSSKIHIYNEDGNIIEDNIYTSTGVLESKVIYNYDKNGNIIEGSQFNQGDLICKATYKLDQFGRIIEENWYNTDGSWDYSCIYKYDSAGNITEITMTDSYSYSIIETYKYDLNNNVIEESDLNNFGSRSVYSFTYSQFDKTGNWTKRNILEDGKLMDITERTIEYY